MHSLQTFADILLPCYFLVRMYLRFFVVSVVLPVHGDSTCTDETVTGYNCTPNQGELETFLCDAIGEPDDPAPFSVIVADEYSCVRCRSNGTDGSTNARSIRNCTLSKTCHYGSVLVDDCRVNRNVDTISCSTRNILPRNSSDNPFIKCTGGVCSTDRDETTVDNATIQDCKKCYSSDIIAVNCANETNQVGFTCNQYFTFDAVQVVNSQAGTTYMFTSGVVDTIYACKVIMCVDSSGVLTYDLDTVTNCSQSNPPLGQGYQS
jgi:hypothetical protein